MGLEWIKNYKIKCFFSSVCLLLFFVFYQYGIFKNIDQYVLEHSVKSINIELTSLMMAITFFGSFIAFLIISLMILCLDLKKGMLGVIYFLLSYFLCKVIQKLFMRTAPISSLLYQNDYCFIDLYTVLSIVIYQYLLSLLKTDYLFFKIMFIILVFGIMISRLYLQAQYFSDVIGGGLLAWWIMNIKNFVVSCINKTS